MKTSRTLTILVLVLTVAHGRAEAYPIPPVTLWSLVEEADAVVLARVLRIEVAEPLSGEEWSRSDHFDRDIAVLEIVETWKGEASGEVRVNFRAGLVCPAPPRFVVGEVVLAFLVRGETHARRWREASAQAEAERVAAPPDDSASDPDAYRPTPEEEAQWREQAKETIARFETWSAGRWLPVAFSYGTLYPDEADRPVFRDLVERATSLQAAGTVEEADRREWLVSAAERRATRWQGLYELAPASDRLHFYYDRGRENAADPLTGEELARLGAGFVREPSVDGTLAMLLGLLAPYPDAEVDRAAAAAIETALERTPRPYWLPSAMAATLRRFGDADPERRLKRDNLDCDGQIRCEWIDMAALPGVWERARIELGIPDLGRVEIPERRVFGVGGETPD